jgi:hypothetical protein
MKVDNERLSKRLLALMQMGVCLVGRDGHIWIEEEPAIDGLSLSSELKRGGVRINSKIYGGILQALDTIDEALEKAGQPPLEEFYSKDIQFLGDPGIDRSRITQLGKTWGEGWL